MIQERKVLKKKKELIGGILEHFSMPGMYMVRLF
jgi:hypothetical protein